LANRGADSSRPRGKSNPRVAAARALAQVLRGASLTTAVAIQRKNLEAADYGLAGELAYGSCRWYYRLQALLEQLQHKPFKSGDTDIRALVLIGLYQLLFTRIPAHAAVAETAGAARVLRKQWAVAVINGMLRRFQREQEFMLAEIIDRPQASYSQPQWFIENIRQSWPDQWQQVLEGLLLRPPFTLRVNLSRISLQEYMARLVDTGATARPVQGVPSALMLDSPVPVESLPGFVEGLVSVQDAGAQLAACLLDPQPGMRILDACAAPGGKTGHLLERAPSIQVTALDVDASRLQMVADNMQRLGYSANLQQGDASKPTGEWAEQTYDQILLDVPCSATGVMRRHPDIRILRRHSDIGELVKRQRLIMDAVWPLLKSGGKMLYATCSVLAQENELQVDAFLSRHNDVEVGALEYAGTASCTHGLQILPKDNVMDGFYYALLEKI
jgi:16S rRNA (cytosine967-C5)-methyltransferase